MTFKQLATVLLTSLLFSIPVHATDQNATPAEESVTADDLVNQFRFLLEQVQRHPEVKKFSELMSDGEWREALSKLTEDYADSFSRLASEAERGLDDLEQQLQTLRERVDEVFAEGNPYDDPIGKTKNAVRALEDRMREQKEQIDNL